MPMEKDFVLQVADAKQEFSYMPEETPFQVLLKEYERVIVTSLITSFGLDSLIKDQHGGDVDTIHNVRQIGKDPEMGYKNERNSADYANRGDYNKNEYHGRDNNYQQTKHDARQNAPNGVVEDAYTGKNIAFSKAAPSESKADLDHVISAKSIHDDRGRVLAGTDGIMLANDPDNLQFTNAHLNRSMGANEIPDYIKNHPELDSTTKEKMMDFYDKSKKKIDAKLMKDYYTSTKFRKDTLKAASKLGVKMGIRQAVGFIFVEIWFAVKEEFKALKTNADESKIASFFRAIGEGIKRGFENAKNKYKEILAQFRDGAIAGMMSSLMTTICNIFFTTAKNVVRVIRQTWASLVEALKILFFNPDNLPLGDRFRAVLKILATGASIVVGSIVQEAVQSTGIGAVPILGDIVATFCGAFTTGIMTVTLLYIMDHAKWMQKLVDWLNNLQMTSRSIENMKANTRAFEAYAAKLAQIDKVEFRKQAQLFNNISNEIEKVQMEDTSLYLVLEKQCKSLGLNIPWNNSENFKSWLSQKGEPLIIG
jgi:hypothetical protein